MRSLKLLLLFLFGISILGCEREMPFPLSGPSLILITSTGAEIVQEPGNEIYVEMELQAASGLESFTVRRDDELLEDINFTNEISSKYVFDYLVPQNTPSGTQQKFVFEVIDREGRSASFEFTLSVRTTFSEIQETVNGVEVTVVKGQVNQDYTFPADRVFVIDSVFAFENGAKLTIEKGSTVYFRTYDQATMFSQLAINRNSQIIAEGTAEEPIVFTSEKVLLGEEPSPTDWGGIFILGNAPTNEGVTVINSGFRYGGNQPNDNSGTMTYVRIEYAGKSGHHGIHFFGVGSRTVVENLQVFRNENIAIRVRGGRVNFRYLSAIGHGGYGIWCDAGWQGNGQFWLFQTDRQATLVPVNFWNIARSLEMRNDPNFFETTPRTTFRISNVTLIGNGFQSGVNNGTRRGVRIRTGARGTLQNMLVTQFPDDGVRVEDLPISDLGENMVLENTRSFNNSGNYEQEGVFFQQNEGFNVNADNVSGIGLDNFVGSVNSNFNPTSLGAYFSSAPFIGAVENESNDWTADGNWFKNLDGTIR